MTPAACITIAALIYVFAVSPTVAVLVGRAIRLRDTQTPRTAVSAGKASTRRPGAEGGLR